MSPVKLPEPVAWKVAASYFSHHDSIPACCLRVVEAVAFDGCHEWRREAVDKCAAAIRGKP